MDKACLSLTSVATRLQDITLNIEPTLYVLVILMETGGACRMRVMAFSRRSSRLLESIHIFATQRQRGVRKNILIVLSYQASALKACFPIKISSRPRLK